MKLSAALLNEQLDEMIISCHFGKHPEMLNLSRPEFLKDGGAFENGHLYIARADSLPSIIKSRDKSFCLITIGTPHSSYLNNGFTVLCADETLDIFDLFNRLHTIFENYDNWELRLLQCVNEKTSMQRFIEISAGVFENPMYIADSTSRQLAKSRHTVFSHTDFGVGDMENLAKRYALQTASGADEAAILWNDHLQLRVLTKALRSHSRFAIAITLIEAERPFRNSDVVLLDYMSGYVLTAFEFEHTSANEEGSPVSLATIFTQLLRNEPVPMENIKNAQNIFGWEPGHLYCVFFVKPPEPEQNFTIRINQCQQLERQFTSAVAIASVDENTAVLVNTSLNNTGSDPLSKFRSLLQKYDFVCGMSCEFDDLSKALDHFAQARYACEYGCAAEPGKRLYDFSDFCLQYMLSHCCDGQDIESLFPKGLRDIIASDRVHGSEHIKTLLAYCDNRFNATHAAKALRIHRTTFLDRFARARDILNIDFDNHSERLHLLISLELLKRKRG